MIGRTLTCVALAACLLAAYGAMADGLATRPADPASGPAAAESRPAPTTRQMSAAEEKRQKADALIGRLSGADANEVAAIEQELFGLGGEAMVPLKLAELSDNFELRQRAAAAASRLRWRLACGEAMLKADPNLLGAMSGPDAHARAAAVDKVASSAGPEAVAFLGECLADPQPFVRQRAIDGLVRVCEGDRSGRELTASVRQKAVRLLESALEDDEDRNIRLLAIGALTKIGAANLDRLAKLLDDDSLEVRATVIRAMGYSGDAKAMAYVKPLLKDPQWRVRGAALEALEKLVREDKSKSVAADVMACLEDEEPYISDLSARLLGNWRYTAAAGQILKLAQEGRISEGAGFSALAQMRDRAARGVLMSKYAEANTVPRKVEVLGLLSEYDPDTEVDRLLEDAIRGEEMKGFRVRLLGLTSRRQNRTRFFALACQFVESDQEDLAEAAGEMVVEESYSYGMPAEQINRLLDGNAARPALVALKASYRYNAPGFHAVLLKAVTHRLPEVAVQAMAMAASIYLSDSFGEGLPGYRRDDSSSYRDPTETPAPLADRLPADVAKEVARNLSRADSRFGRVFAAAILYRSGADQGEAVLKVLREALRDPEPSIRLKAMAGIVEKPQPLMAAFDVIAASRDEQLVGRAIDIMAGLQDANFAPRLMELAGDIDLDNRGLMRALILSGNPKAVDLVLAKAVKADGYSRRSLAEGLARSPGPGPVRFVHEMYKMEKDEYDREKLGEVLTTFNDPSAKPILLAMLEEKKSTYGGGLKSKALARLVELDPAGSAERLKKLMDSGDRSSLESAVEGLLRTKPTADVVGVVLDLAGKETSADNSDLWYGLIGWVPAEDLRAKFLPALSKLNAAAQDALLRRVSRDLEERDLAPLMGASVHNAFTQMWLSALVGQLTADRQALRPSLEKLSATSPASLPGVLIAAGDWGDAPAVLSSYLADSRPEVASAACAGLSFYLLGHPEAPLTEAMREAMTRTIRAKEVIPAYLAAEALGLHDGNALLRIEPNSISASTALLRLAVQWGKDVPPALQAVVRSTLTKNVGPTTMQLAAVAAAADWQDAYSIRLDNLRDRISPRLIVRMILAAKKTDLLRQLYRGYGSLMIVRDVPEPVLREMIAKDRKDDLQFFMQLVAAGLVPKPEEGDLVRLVKAAGLSATGSSYAGLPDWPDRWGVLPEDPEVVKLIAPDKPVGVLAAAMAASQWDSNAGHDALLKAATTVPRKGNYAGQQSSLQMIALKGLRLCARPADANALIEAWKKSDPEDYQQREYRGEMFSLIASLRPGEALKLAVPLFDSSRGGSELISLLSGLETLIADGNAWEDLGSLSERPKDDSRLDALRQLKAAAAPRSTAAPDSDSSDQWMMESAAPWGDSPYIGFGSDLPQYADAAALAGGVLEQFVERAKEFEKNAAENDEGQGDLPRAIAMSRRQYSSRSSQDDSAAGRLAGETLQQFSLTTGPDEFYFGRAGAFPVGLYLPGDRIAKALRPLLSQESLPARTFAMRAAAAWRVAELSDAVAARLDGNRSEVVEAAWALASLKGRSAAGPIAIAYQRQQDFDARVGLACLLRMLGDDRGGPDIDRAVSLTTTRQFRMKFLSQQAPQTPSAAYRDGYYQGRYGSSGVSYDSLASGGGVEGRLLPWSNALRTAAPELLGRAMKAFPVPPTEVAEDEAGAEEAPPGAAPAGGAAGATGAGKIDLSGLRLDAQGVLVVYPSSVNSLPMSALAGGAETYSGGGPSYRSYSLASYSGGDDRGSLGFAKLPGAEESLEPLCFVQFADQAASAVDLRSRWRAWWGANKDKPRADWWCQAAGQAVAELTHEKWWFRMLGARRLMRLTGRAVAVPNPFDLPAWAALQGQWKKWLAGHENEDPRLWLVDAAIEAKVLNAADRAGIVADASAASRPAEGGPWLRALVQMAGSGKHPLSAAAMVQLKSWDDRDGLAAACLPWQDSPVEDLRFWARRELQRYTGKRLLVFTQADLTPRSATRPAEE